MAATISSGSHAGNVITLQLASASNSSSIDYVQDQKPTWDGFAAKLIFGTNGIAALTFADVTIDEPSSYVTWANGAPFDGDANNDGVKNGVAWVLGAANPTVNANALVPALEKDGAQWVFEYNRHDDSLLPVTTQIVQYGNDLVGWTDITIPTTSAGAVTITPGTPTDHVRVVIPDVGEKMFARLKVIK